MLQDPRNRNLTPQDPMYKLAKRRVQEKIEFQQHLRSYLGVNALCFVIWLVTSIASGGMIYPWFLWVAGPWGIGLAIHFFTTYFNGPDTPTNRDRMMQEELRRMGATPPPAPTYNLPDAGDEFDRELRKSNPMSDNTWPNANQPNDPNRP